jgi:hypothetical protein
MAKLTVKLVEEKLREYRGNCAAVGRAFDVTRSAVAHYIERHPSLHCVLRECREVMKDHAESALHRAIIDGEPWAICFFLKCQGKDRGYTERTEHDLRGEVRQEIVVEIVESPGYRGASLGRMKDEKMVSDRLPVNCDGADE